MDDLEPVYLEPISRVLVNNHAYGRSKARHEGSRGPSGWESDELPPSYHNRIEGSSDKFSGRDVPVRRARPRIPALIPRNEGLAVRQIPWRVSGIWSFQSRPSARLPKQQPKLTSESYHKSYVGSVESVISCWLGMKFWGGLRPTHINHEKLGDNYHHLPRPVPQVPQIPQTSQIPTNST